MGHREGLVARRTTRTAHITVAPESLGIISEERVVIGAVQEVEIDGGSGG